MDRRQLIMQAENAIREMNQARDKYCGQSNKDTVSETLHEILLATTDNDFDECCCMGIIVVIILGIPSLILWQFEKIYLNWKFNRIMDKAKSECNLYLQYLGQYLRMYPDSRIDISAINAFVRNCYIGTLNKKKTFFGLLQKDEDWRVRSISMAIQEIQNHLRLL